MPVADRSRHCPRLVTTITWLWPSSVKCPPVATVGDGRSVQLVRARGFAVVLQYLVVELWITVVVEDLLAGLRVAPDVLLAVPISRSSRPPPPSAWGALGKARSSCPLELRSLVRPSQLVLRRSLRASQLPGPRAGGARSRHRRHPHPSRLGSFRIRALGRVGRSVWIIDPVMRFSIRTSVMARQRSAAPVPRRHTSSRGWRPPSSGWGPQGRRASRPAAADGRFGRRPVRRHGGGRP